MSSGTNEDDSETGPDDEETNDQKNSADKAEDDEKQEDAPSVSTPSDMEDTTVPGGTVIPAVKSQIFSWSWYDPEENLLDGKLELSGVTEEAQPSFEEVTEYLPQAIIAQVGEESEAGKEEKLPITGWSCNEYVQDEEGCWPLEGTYEFAAELPEAYELAEDVDALVVEVSVTGDQAALTAYDPNNVVLSVNFEEGESFKNLAYNESGFSSLRNDVMNLLKQHGITVTSSGENRFQLIMTNASIQNLELSRGTWEIVLNESNVLKGKGTQVGGVGLKIKENVRATIKAGTAPASLTAHNYPTTGTSNDGSSGIAVEGNLTIESGTIEATADAGKNSAPFSGGIVVGREGILNINGGAVTAAGTGKNGVFVRGNFRMKGGSLTATGSRKPGIENEGTFELSGGTISTSADNGGTGFVQRGKPAMIKANELNTDRLNITGNSSFTVARGGKVTSGSTIINSGTLTNEGEFVSNGPFVKEKDGTFINKGTISGNGSLPDDLKQKPGNITVNQAEISAGYRDNMLIDVPSLAGIHKPVNAGNLQYELAEYTGSDKGEGTINEETGQLTVKKAGVFKIKVNTQASGLYEAGKNPVYITLTVNKAAFPDHWNLIVTATSDIYNGSKGYPAAAISASGIPKGAGYEYQLKRTKNTDDLQEDQWKSECPKIVNVAESEQFVFVRVTVDNYESKVFCSDNRTSITERSFTDTKVTLEPETVIYNGQSRNPEIKVVENWQGTSGDEVNKADYTIKYWTYWTGTDNSIVRERKDAGTYTVHLLGQGNYKNESNTAIFTIDKCKLNARITGYSFDKVYDGTTDITEEQNLSVQLYSDSGTPDSQDVRADQVNLAYQSADVGEHDIEAANITLAGDNAKNYELTENSTSIKGNIVARDFASMTVSADPLTYNGTEQKPQIQASVETGLSNVSPDAVVFTYSKNGVDYQSEIPGFTDAGTYQVYVKASMANFNDAVKTVNVTVQQAPSSSGSHSGGGGKGSSGKSSSGSSGTVTKDSQKGYRSEEQGVITGASNQAVNDGYSHWIKDARGWWLRYSDGTWPMGNTGAFHWEKVNGRWWAFGAEGYLSTGWIYDTLYQGWFYMDENQGMLTGWQFINGKWYYLNSNQDGSAGIMYSKRRTPDGWYVKEDGSWDEEAGR
ncbi:N-acetylmuramoyl-L-alanine amidase family protein [uncultured Clostridium sp.]|uniref:N-acetylmuramoyl-L-alanine amidase family protein n=1 Tax=uncultured Clostridium sp. TaxID=59620 RepID=UPI00265FB635|nr:YDG domain-containing protein [uncultured Clostridium sp.]